MPSTALQLITEAYRAHNLNEITTFSTSLEFPYNLAKDALNAVIREMNRQGNFWFTETKTPLPYSPGVYTYSLSTLALDPKRITRLRREAVNSTGELTELNYRRFQQQSRQAPVTTAQPQSWSKYADTLELNTIPDQDYTLVAYHFKDMPLITATTDTTLIPERDEDVLIDCCYQWLGYKLGKWDLGSALQAMNLKIRPLLANTKQDAGLPLQMPASF